MNQVLASAFTDELEKVARVSPGVFLARQFENLSPAVQTALQVGLIAGAGIAGTHVGAGKKARAQMRRERRDPRLYSNLRGMVTLESRKKRIAAHRNLGKGDGTVLTAMKQGFGRTK